ncbi:MAG: hypothetical protein ABSG82_09140 [Sedimentisphaerales bacterium]|jgi:hypothetical protein
MVFWIGILIAVGFAYSAIKLGFYYAWTMLFNVVVAVYVGIRLGPLISEFVPMGGQYCRTLAVLAAGVGTFLVLHGISSAFLLGQFEVTFPRLLNTLGAGLLGLMAGFLVWSFAALVVYTTPFSENASVKEVGFNSKQFKEAKIQPYLVWWCNFVDKFVALENGGTTSAENTIKDLMTKPKPAQKSVMTIGANKPADANEPNQPTDMNEPNKPHSPHRLSPAPPVSQPNSLLKLPRRTLPQDDQP